MAACSRVSRHRFPSLSAQVQLHVDELVAGLDLDATVRPSAITHEYLEYSPCKYPGVTYPATSATFYEPRQCRRQEFAAWCPDDVTYASCDGLGLAMA